MLEETLKNFKKNSLFFVIILAVIIFFSIISLFINNKYSDIEEVEELPDSSSGSISKLIINEVQSSNGGAYADANGNTYDWVELYNGSSKDKDLTGYSLSDSADSIKWAFPDNTIIKSGEYLVIFLSGTNDNGLYANFKLKASGGETLILRSYTKKIVDAVDTVSSRKNQSMARMSNGSFVLTKTATPGYENTKEGYESLVTGMKQTETKKLSITEILPNNKGYFKDSYNEYSGYVEVTNISNSSVKLKGYSLSNDLSLPYRWSLPDISLSKGESVVLYTSNRDVSEKEYHTNFKLNNTDGVVILTKDNLIEDKVEYALTNGLAYIKGTNSYYESSMISPGYPNASDGINSFQNKYLTKNKGLIINEVMTSNYSYLVQNGYNYYDWIELYNNSSKDINLKDYYLTTTTNSPKMYNLPDAVVKAGTYYILMASGDSSLSNNSYKHTNFKLSDDEGLFLYKNNNVVDSMFISNIPVGNSYGRYGSSGLYYFNSPSPGKSNNSGNMQISYTPRFSKEAGVYNNIEKINLTISCEGNTYYTVDGSTPSTSSKVLNGNLVLKNTTVVKAMCYEQGKRSGKIITKSYVINENHTLPVLSMSINSSDFSAINRNLWELDYEKPGYAELFEDGKSFSIPMGLKLFGGAARGLPKKGFLLSFRKKYGEGSLNYQVFDNRDNSVYNEIVLRSASQDEENAMIRDVLGTSLVEKGKLNLDVQAYKTIILYINGEYWGIYWIREKVNESFVSSHYNVDPSKTDIIRIDGDVTSGINKNYNSLMNYVESHDLSKKEYYDYVASKIDIDSLIDFWVAETYITNNDIVNCRFFSNPGVDGGKWNYIFYDLDFAFYNYSRDYFKFSTNISGMNPKGYPTTLLRNLLKNKEFEKRYLERLSYQLKNVWTKDNIMKKYNELLNEIKPEINRDFARWNKSKTEFENELSRFRTYVDKREDYLINQTKSFFNLTNAEMKEYFGD